MHQVISIKEVFKPIMIWEKKQILIHNRVWGAFNKKTQKEGTAKPF
jgi:hypothetical protein